MLAIVVSSFFVCWAPLYIINTITLFDEAAVYKTSVPQATEYAQQYYFQARRDRGPHFLLPGLRQLLPQPDRLLLHELHVPTRLFSAVQT